MVQEIASSFDLNKSCLLLSHTQNSTKNNNNNNNESTIDRNKTQNLSKIEKSFPSFSFSFPQKKVKLLLAPCVFILTCN